MNYQPNLDALKVILDKINPVVLADSSFKYKIIICGKGLPDELDSLKGYANKNIIYAGFIQDINIYYKAADIFLNPVQSGGGVKTKMVEAIAFGTTVVSTESGAAGIVKNVCGEKLIVIKNNDWDGFAKAIIDNVDNAAITPQEYYNNYFYGTVIKRLIALT